MDCLSNKKVKVFNTSLLNLNSNEVNEKEILNFKESKRISQESY